MNKIETAKYRLAYYCSKYDWVKELVNIHNIDFGLDNLCTQEEIEDYINVLTTDTPIDETIKILREQMNGADDDLEKAKICDMILNLNKIKNKWYLC